MEEWAELRDEGNGKGKLWLAFDLDFQIEKYCFDSGKERLRSLFDQLLVAFMREKSASKCIRPIPALCSDGRPVDLFQLFWVVRKIGGHDAVSRKNLWGFVSEECGLGVGVIPSIKLIYMKYLNEMDQWLRQASSQGVLEDGHSELVQKLDLLSRELESRSKSSISRQEKDGKNVSESESELYFSSDGGISGPVNNANHFFIDKNDKLCGSNDHYRNINENINDDFTELGKSSSSKGKCDDDSGNSSNEDSGNIMTSARRVIEKVMNKVLSSGEAIASMDDDNSDVSKAAKKVFKKVLSKSLELSENIKDGEERFSIPQGIDITIPARNDIRSVLDSRKRKREVHSFTGMLNWLTHVAKRCDPLVGLIPECSKWGDYGNEEFWVQALLVREALLIKRNGNTNAGEDFVKDQQKKPRMHPSMYEDNIHDHHQSTEKLRCSKRVSSLTKFHSCPCCNSRETSQSKDITRVEARIAKPPTTPPKLLATNVEEPPANANGHKLLEAPAEKQVSVGPLFQAEVPKWSGVVSQSDPKWLGSTMWPPKDGGNNGMIRLDFIGKGRQQSCDCQFRDSVECIRFHVAEKRFKLKRELGSLFYHWRFDQMGEEVSLSWTEEEEKRFKDMMRSFASVPNKFWKYASRLLPSKTREKLVSYYFNVFLIQRRNYQNRVTPKDIDSDDDEKECGRIGDSFGYKALRIPGLRLIPCTVNKESTELV